MRCARVRDHFYLGQAVLVVLIVMLFAAQIESLLREETVSNFAVAL